MVRKLFLKGAIFTLLACSGLYAYDRYMFYTKENNLRALSEEISTVDNARYLSFGNSIGERLHIGYSNKEDMANLCINGNDIFIIAEQLRALEPSLRSDNVVLVNLSFFAPHYLTSRLPNHLKQNMVMFYYALPVSNIRPWNADQTLKNKIFVVSHLKNLDKLLKESISGKSKSQAEDPADGEGGGWVVADEKSKIDTAHERYRGQIFSGEMDLSLKYSPDLPKRFEEAIREIQEICQRKKCRLVFYSMPVHGHFQIGFGQKKADSLKVYLEKFMVERKAEYYFHYDDPQFLQHGELFKDGNHLNEKGAGMFANLLFNEISKADPTKYRLSSEE